MSIHHAFVENGSDQLTGTGNRFKYRSIVLDEDGLIRPVTRLQHGADRHTIQKAFPGDLVLTVEFDGQREIFSLSRYLNHQHMGTMRKQLLFSLDTTEMDSLPPGECSVYDNLDPALKHFLFVDDHCVLPDGFGWMNGVSREGYDKALFANKLFEFMPLKWLEGFVDDISKSPRFSVDYDVRVKNHVPNSLDYTGTIGTYPFANPEARVEWLLFTDNWDVSLSTAENPLATEGIVAAFKIYRNAYVYDGKPYGAYIVFHSADGRDFKPRRDSR